MFNSPMDAIAKVASHSQPWFIKIPGIKPCNCNCMVILWDFLLRIVHCLSRSKKTEVSFPQIVFCEGSGYQHNDSWWLLATLSKLLWSQPIPFRQSIAEDQPESVDRWCRARKPISETFTVFSVPFSWGTPQKLIWQWKIHHLKMYFLLNIGMFHCHVSLFGLQPSDTFAAKHRVCGTVGRWYIPFWMASWESGFVVSKFDAQHDFGKWLSLYNLYHMRG